VTQLAGLRRRSRNSAAAAFDLRDAERRSSGGGNGVRRRRTRTPAATAPTAIDAPAIRIAASDPSRSPGRARYMGPLAPGRRAPRRGERRYPEGSIAGHVEKARGGDPGHQPRGKHRQEAAAFKQGMDLPQLGATHGGRLELRASRGSCQREGSEHRPRDIAGVGRIHAPRAIAGAATPAAPHRRRLAIDVSPSV